MTPSLPSSSFSCVLVGQESLLIQCGEVALEKGGEIRAVVSRNPQIIDWAQAKSIATMAPGKALSAGLAPLEFDYFFSITNLAMIAPEVLAMATKASINFHDGPLPRYAGMYTPAWAILGGEKQYGVTFHKMTEGADEGEIYVQHSFELLPDETSLTLNTRCYEAAIESFSELIDGLTGAGIETTPQNMDERTYFERYRRPEAAGVLDWRRPAPEVAASIRAMDFGRYENAFGSAKVVHGDRVCVVAEVTVSDQSGTPGTLLSVSDDALIVATGDSDALSLARFTCQKGVSLTATEAAAHLGITQGEVFSNLDDTTRGRLTAHNAHTTPSEAYWVRHLRQLDPVEIPYRTRAESGTSSPSTVEIEIPAGFGAKFSEEPSVAIVGAFAAYLSRIASRSTFDLAFQDLTAADKVRGLEAIYAPSVPLRIDVDAQGSVGAAVECVEAVVAVARQRDSFLRDVVARYPDLSAGTLSKTESLAPVSVVIADNVSDYTLSPGTDCALVVAADGGSVRFVHCPAALMSASAERIRDQFTTFLADMASSEAGAPLARVALLADDERDRILNEWNQTAVEFDRASCIHSLFEARAVATPDTTAVVYESQSLSYRELDERANQLAHHLNGLGIGPDKLVGVYLERSIEMMVGIMGVLKAGGAYVPLDPTYPSERIAYMIEDSKVSVVLTQQRLLDSLSTSDANVVVVDRDRASLDAHPTSSVTSSVAPEHLSYVIYTSGSTGNPKGVMVEHRNVVNFFVGMDERVPHEPPGSWLAVTSLSFDISVLELLWTLTRGFKVVVHADSERSASDTTAALAGPWRPIDFGLAMWGSDEGPGPKKYELMLESAKFGDRNGFSSFLTPERHFGAFGGPFPNPSVTGAAIAAVTEHIRIRAGSCVLPLHHPIRIAEDYAVVDNLSNGRVEISFASGWQPNDFVIRPGAFKTAKTHMFEGAAQVQALWRGEAVPFENPMGDMVPTSTLPRPVQPELPSWYTTAGNVQSFEAAGAAGFNIFTHLLGQNLEELATKIKVYRKARKTAGHDPETGIVSLMLHTFVGEDNDAIRELVRAPMKDYLGAAMKLVIGFAWSFPAFDRPGGPDSKPEDVDLASLTEEEADTILEFAFERYYETSGLFGTPGICTEMVDRVKAAGVSEICSLIDYGLPTDIVLKSLPALNDLREQVNLVPEGLQSFEVGSATETKSYALEDQVAEHAITHLQCTPSHAKMLVTNPDTKGSLGDIAHMMIGGEAFPVSLAAELDGVAGGSVTNMYGPTETTIWSSTEAIVGSPDVVSIGRPIANTQLYILDAGCEPLPIGVPGELLIGGEGVVRGYLERPDLTDERFIPDPFSKRPGARLYRTGDLARWNDDGTIDFLGRMDHQVKLRGYRIELGEIETRLGQQPGIRECVVVAREDTPGDTRLVAYLVPAAGSVEDDSLRTALRENLPDFMVPSLFVELDRFPMTPNGKIDRKALPAPDQVRGRAEAEFKAPENELEQLISDVWKAVLYLESVGTNENFFDLGGHSLLVVQAHRKLREVCEHKISLTDLYRFPTIAGLADFLGTGGDAAVQAKQSQDRGAKRRAAMGRRRNRGRG